jgi:predicted phage terminase large subunit-like protein
MPSDPKQIAFDREFVRRYGLLGFTFLAWPLVEPAQQYVHNWHIEEVCRHVEACYLGTHPEMLINVPPGTGKSLICSVMALPWIWTIQPGFRLGNWSFADKNVRRDGGKAFTIITSEWYRERWPDVVIDRKRSCATTEFWNTQGGLRYASTVHGQGTGYHFHCRQVDDCLKPADAMGNAVATKLEIDFVNQVWWDGTISTRVLDPHCPRFLNIMQRLHEYDLAGYLKVKHPGLTHLCLPMRFEPDRACRTSLGGDRRTIDGELLFANRFPESYVRGLEAQLGIYARAQLQQDPCDPEGSVFKLAHFRRWTELPKLTTLILSGDMTFKKSAGSDRVSLQVWGSDGRDFYLVENVTDLMGFVDTVRNCRALVSRFPDIGAKLIEDTANGPSVIETLNEAMNGVIAVTPEGGKIARANSTSHLWQAGNVYLPQDDYAPWVPGYIAELLAFPRGRHDDQVDSTSQALIFLAKNTGSLWAWLDQESLKGSQLVVEPGGLSPFA